MAKGGRGGPGGPSPPSPFADLAEGLADLRRVIQAQVEPALTLRQTR